ncbi:MAG TPA: M20 family metallopeptidase [Bacteroidales bacterium]|nr:M20 family metallopeptidase [Bacteroidales bacterium]
MKEHILREAESLLPEIVEIRRHIHQHPELSYAEYETAAFISSKLDTMGIEHRTGIAGTGIVGFIRGEAAGRGLTIGLRADMDALPISEAGASEYHSRNEGVMHACGHDAHVAMLIGAAGIIKSLRKKFAGTVLLVFQPGEEKAPGGARMMIETGIFRNFNPDMLIAQHILPDMQSGTVGFHAGPYLASCDEIYITVAGRGGHAAQPSQYTDQIYIASELVISLKDTVAEKSKGQAATILGIGKITGMGATNVIPEKVEIAGTFRTFDERWRKEAKEIIRKTASEIARKRGASIDVNIVEGYPVLVNNEPLTNRAVELSRQLLGEAKVKEVPDRMSSEDFSFFAEKYPSFLFRLGITSDGEKMRPAHTPYFDMDESSMATGTATMAWLALNLIKALRG